MKQPIQLTPNDGVIHVDEVRVEDGVYAKTGGMIAYWIDHEMNFIKPTDSTKNGIRYDSFKHAVECWSSCWDIFTLSGIRIVIKKPLMIADLANSDFVGFIGKSGNKGYIVFTGNGDYAALSMYLDFSTCNTYFNIGNNSVSMALKRTEPVSAYRFDTPQELHKWLGED